MAWQQDIVVAYRDWHLTVVEEPGWVTRSAGSWAYGKPMAHLLHQFVIRYGVPDENGVSMLMNGYNTGTYFLYPPVANQYLGQTGIIYMIGGGLAQHAGQGVRRVFDNAIADRPPLGDGQNAPGPDDWSGGSSCYLGTESHHPGDTTPYRQYPQAVLMGAAMCQLFGWSEYRFLEHSNHSTRKAQDLVSIDGNQLRRDIRTAMNTGGGGFNNDDGWLTVGAKEEILDALKNRTPGSQSVFDELRYATHDILLPHMDQLRADVTAAVVASFTPLLANIQNAALTAATNPQGGRYGMVQDDATGAIYAVAPGFFWHIPDLPTLELGQKVGLYDNDVHHTDHAGTVTVREIALAGGATGDPVIEPVTTYTVVAGDTWTGICGKLGVTSDALKAANPQVTDINVINVGQVLVVPPKAG